MVELSFLKSGSKYICEFEVSSDFNLHVEREKGGYLFLYQRSSESGNYDSVGDAKFAPQDLVVDYDCSALVYPKYIKIVSEVEPSYAAITTDGEVTEIKSQSKEVEITSNGVTEIAPDAGFGYLSGVKVNVNVPQSGGSGDAPSQPSGGSGEKYYVPSVEMAGAAIYSSLCKCVSTLDRAFYAIVPPATYLAGMGGLNDLVSSTVAISINLDKKISFTSDNGIMTMTIKETLLLQFGIDITSGLTEITEEEFYDVNNLHQ